MMNQNDEIRNTKGKSMSVSTIRAILCGVGDSTPERIRHLADLARLDETVDQIVEVATAHPNDEAWETVFDAVFGGEIDVRCNSVMSALGLEIPDYYDPDTTYKDDAMAWITAFRLVSKPLLAETMARNSGSSALRDIADRLAEIEREAWEIPDGQMAASQIGATRAAVAIMAAG